MKTAKRPTEKEKYVSFSLSATTRNVNSTSAKRNVNNWAFIFQAQAISSNTKCNMYP